MRLSVGVLLVLTALTGAACGGSGKATSTAAPASNSTISKASSNVGDILVGSDGKTLYLFAKDRGGTSACSGDCAKAWPPYAGKGAKLRAGFGLEAALLKRTTRADGSKQLTYNGHPLYTFSGDSKPGDINGQGSDAYGAHWYALSPQGAAIQKMPAHGGMGY